MDRLTSGLHAAEMMSLPDGRAWQNRARHETWRNTVAVNQKKPVAVFSLEMSSQQLVQRMLCSARASICSGVRDGFLGERDFPSLTAAASKLAEAKILSMTVHRWKF